jgi:hypothetical protein
MEFYKAFEDIRQHWSELIGLRFMWVRESDADLREGFRVVFQMKAKKYRQELKDFNVYIEELMVKYEDPEYDLSGKPADPREDY